MGEENNKVDDLLKLEWELLMSINESGRGITTFLLSYFITLNLAIYGGMAWVKFESTIGADWKWIVLVLLSLVLIILNLSIFQIYLRNTLFADSNWKTSSKNKGIFE